MRLILVLTMLLIISIMRTPPSEATKFEDLELKNPITVWIDSTPLISTSLKVDKESSHSIINELKWFGAVLALNRNLMKEVSPSLELVMEDTGVDKFLKHSTLKHSAKAALSDSESDTEGGYTGCGALKEGNKMYFHTCPGDLVVVTLAGSMKMTCIEIERRVFFGPVTIKNLKCQQSFTFDFDCTKKKPTYE